MINPSRRAGKFEILCIAHWFAELQSLELASLQTQNKVAWDFLVYLTGGIAKRLTENKQYPHTMPISCSSLLWGYENRHA